jgi:ribosomal protein L16/L10AE
MKMIPNLNKVKFKRPHKVNKRNLFCLEKKSFSLLFGRFGIQALESGRLTFKQIEACRRTIRRGLRKKGRL